MQYETSFEDTLQVSESLDLNIRNYIVNTGGFVILRPNVFNKSPVIPASRNRTNDVYINRGYTDIDVIHFILPVDYEQEIAPVYKKVESPMVEYEFKITIDNGMITSYRRFQLREGTYPPDTYQQLYDAMVAIRANDLIRLNIPVGANK